MAKRKYTDERRKALRAKRILSIQYRLVQTKGKFYPGKWYISTTYDMSFLGIAFLSEKDFKVDDVLELQVIMSGIIDIYTGYARVVRVERKKQGGYVLVGVELIEKPATRRRRTAKSPKKAATSPKKKSTSRKKTTSKKKTSSK